jgi:pyridoxal phosphate enzyme (YggS family)
MTATRTDPAAPLRDAYRQIKERISAAAQRSGRSADEVLLVAVTKYATPDQIRQLVELGQVDLGESRVQQLAQRAPQMTEWLARKRTLARAAPKSDVPVPEQVRWHMIGHMQRNKVKHAAPLVSLIQSVDSLRLAEELHGFGAKQDSVIDVLLQVNTAGESRKHGLSPAAAPHVAEQIDTMMHLRLRGLMCMAPYCEDPEDARTTFRRTAEMFHDIRRTGLHGSTFNILSMGMSGDFEVAIEEGSNLVRVGSALFGEPNAKEHDETPED